ncbi:RNA polymerase sigma factor [Flavitalea flava]
MSSSSSLSILNGMDIMTGLKSGEPNALRILHGHYYHSLRVFANNLLGEIPGAEETLTDIFIMLWRKHGDFETLQNVKAFLFISTKNACINLIKQHQRDTNRKTGLINYLSPDHEEFILNQMIRAEWLQQIYQAMEGLPPQCRHILKLSYLEGMSNAQIAALSKLSVNTVKNHKVRGLNLLRRKCPPDS